MKKTHLLCILTGLVTFSLALSGRAAPIDGAITFDGTALVDTPFADTATRVIAWAGENGMNEPFVGVALGDFQNIASGTPVALAAPWMFNTGSGALTFGASGKTTSPPIQSTFWSVGGFSFDLSSSSIVSQGNGRVLVRGSGTISGNGFDPTPGTWDFLIDTDPVGKKLFKFQGAAKTIKCVGRIGDFVWQDTNQNGCQDPGEPGIEGVRVDLYQGCVTPGGTPFATTTTGPDGRYLFTDLCAGTYTVSFHTPAGYTRTLANQNCSLGGGNSDEKDSDCACQGTGVCGVCVTLVSDDAEDLTIDCGYITACNLSVTKVCLPPPPAPGNFNCSDAKPITRLIVRWNGNTSPIYVKAWNGSVGSGTPTTFGPVATGERLTFTRSGTFPNDIYFEIFNNAAMTAGSKLGESTFHLSCSDSDMNGPEDCGTPQGNGKNNSASFINDWALEGMAGASLGFDCSPVVPPGSNDCSVQVAPMASCETVGRPESLVFRYTGGGCGASTNPQGGRFTCTGSVNTAQAIAVTSNGLTVTPGSVQPGAEFTVSGSFGSQTSIQLSNGGGTETLSIHTSCSKPLAVGDVFGDLTLVGFNGQTGGSPIIYRYTVTNSGATTLNNVNVTDDQLGAIAGPVTLAAGQSMSFDRLAQLTETTQNIATATATDAGGQTCSATSLPVVVTVMQNCPDWSGAPVFSDKKLQRNAANTGLTNVTMTGVTVSWPASNGKLKKVKLDGDTIWDAGSPTGATSITLGSTDFTSDTDKKSIAAGVTRLFVLEFENTASTNIGSYNLSVSFGSNCTLTIP